jgi:hypothetical protein
MLPSGSPRIRSMASPWSLNLVVDGELGRRPEVSAHSRADTCVGELAAHRLGDAAFEPLGQRRDCQGGWVATSRWWALPLNSTNSTSSSADTARMVCSEQVSILPVNSRRRYLVTDTRCACSNERMWRARRYVRVVIGGFTVGLCRRATRYRIEPTQQRMLARVFGCYRVVQRRALRAR